MRTTLLRFFLGAAASAALLAGCGGGDVSPNAGEVRLVNATADTLDLYAEEKDDLDLLNDDVAPSTAGRYEDLNKGTYTFSVRGGVAGATVASLSQALEKNGRLSLIAYTSAGTSALAAFDEDEDRPDKGSAKVRFFNTASSDSGAVDAYLIASGSACSGLPSAVASGVSGLQESFIQLTPSVPAPYQFRLCVTAAGDPTDVRLAADITIGDREVVTIVLTRTAGAVLLNATLVVQDGDVTQAANASARMRLAVGVGSGQVSAKFEAATSDISLGSEVGAPSVGTYRLVPTTGTTLSVTWKGDSVTVPQVTLTGGADYTLLVTTDSPVATTATATFLADDNSLSTNTAKPNRIRLVHGATTTSVLSMTVGTNPVDNVLHGAASPYILAEASGSTQTTVTVRQGTTVLCTGTSALSATVYSVFALGNLDGSSVGPCIVVNDR
jgi:hypothetical protein